MIFANSSSLLWSVRRTLQLAVTVARYRSIVLLLHRQRLAQTGTSDNHRQANNPRGCRLVISRRNDCARNTGAEHTSLPLFRESVRDHKNNYRGLPPNARKPVCGPETKEDRHLVVPYHISYTYVWGVQKIREGCQISLGYLEWGCKIN